MNHIKLILILTLFFCNPNSKIDDGSVYLLDKNHTCNIQNGSCKITIQNREISQYPVEITILIDPTPIESGKKHFFTIQLSNPSLIPEFLDLDGEEMDMGYNRPLFYKKKENVYMAEFSPGNCVSELTKWKALVGFKKIGGRVYGLSFPFVIKKTNATERK